MDLSNKVNIMTSIYTIFKLSFRVCQTNIKPIKIDSYIYIIFDIVLACF